MRSIQRQMRRTAERKLEFHKREIEAIENALASDMEEQVIQPVLGVIEEVRAIREHGDYDNDAYLVLNRIRDAGLDRLEKLLQKRLTSADASDIVNIDSKSDENVLTAASSAS